MSDQGPKPPTHNESIPPPPVVNSPNSIPPPLGSNDVVRTKRNTKSSSNDVKLSLKNKKVIAKPHTGSLRKGSKKGNKNRDLTKEMEEIEYEDDVSEDMEVRDEVFEVNNGSSKAGMGPGFQGMNGLDGGSYSATSAHVDTKTGNVSNIDVSGQSKSSVSANVPNVAGTNTRNGSYEIGEIPVPFDKNPILNPEVSVTNGNGKASSAGSKGIGNNNNVWPSLKETVNAGVSKDTEMQEVNNGNKFGSFVNAVQGNPIIMDRITTQMCERGYGRASFARVLIEIDAAKGLLDNVEICYNNLGRSMWLRVEYTWRPPVCSQCKVFGHDFKDCFHRVLTEEEKNEKLATKNNVNTKPMDTEKKNDVWQDVNGKSNSRNYGGTNRGYGQQSGSSGNVNRGGFNGRGRGGFNSRGGGNQRVNGGGRNGGEQFMPAKDKGVNADESNDGLKNVNVDGKSKDKSNMGNGGSSEAKKVMQSEIKTTNMFDTLANESVEEGSATITKDNMDDVVAAESHGNAKLMTQNVVANGIESGSNLMKGESITNDPSIGLKSRIDKLQKNLSLCVKNLHGNAKKIAEQRIKDECDGKRTQSSYNLFYSQAYEVELKNIKQMKWQKDMLEVDLFVNSGQSLNDNIKVLWSNEMVKYYENVYDERKNDTTNGHGCDYEETSNAGY
ncbi:hypothetical protein CTI12_AA127080 [Artemisia annua]|uniref:Zinc knuckle CX2CX4HX4C n=1 Tax=Artemisia annua TaxID=35608 RepID=A0A2U1PPX0_ARTAN|nr:hypothetical protein CTI12_AA127080 [Artemisia annua]